MVVLINGQDAEMPPVLAIPNRHGCRGLFLFFNLRMVSVLPENHFANNPLNVLFNRHHQ
jgi:hypothetical protein